MHTLFDSQYNMVDRMNQDYHMHYQKHGSKSVNSWALHSALFYFFLTVRSLWEEHRVVHAFNHSQGSKHAALQVEPLTIASFVVKCASALSKAE